jgi:hypothetical protein
MNMARIPIRVRWLCDVLSSEFPQKLRLCTNIAVGKALFNCISKKNFSSTAALVLRSQTVMCCDSLIYKQISKLDLYADLPTKIPFWCRLYNDPLLLRSLLAT